jgi:hypothetical protein
MRLLGKNGHPIVVSYHKDPHVIDSDATSPFQSSAQPEGFEEAWHIIESAEQPSNAFDPTDVTQCEIVIEVREEQLLNALYCISVTDSGIDIEASAEQSENVVPLILSTRDGMVIVVNLEQYPNAKSSIIVTDSGMAIEVIEEQ